MRAVSAKSSDKTYRSLEKVNSCFTSAPVFQNNHSILTFPLWSVLGTSTLIGDPVVKPINQAQIEAESLKVSQRKWHRPEETLTED